MVETVELMLATLCDRFKVSKELLKRSRDDIERQSWGQADVDQDCMREYRRRGMASIDIFFAAEAHRVKRQNANGYNAVHCV